MRGPVLAQPMFVILSRRNPTRKTLDSAYSLTFPTQVMPPYSA